MLKRLLVVLALVAPVTLISVVEQARLRAQAGAGALSISTLGVPVGENFDTLIATGSATWTNDSTLFGWYHARTGSGTTIVANNGSSNAGNLYSYGTGTSTERALGSIGSGNAAAGNFHWGVRLANGTGTTITSLTVSYRGEQWRNGAAPAQTIDFSYRIGTGLGGTLTDFTTGGVAVPELDFTSPVTGGTTGTALDGNINAVPISFTITGLSLAPQQEILLRWSDIDHPSSDHGLAIDDFVVTAEGGGPAEPTLSIDDVSLAEGNAGTVTATFTVGVSTTAHSGITFDIATVDGTATVADFDYVAQSLTGQVIPAGAASYSFAVIVNSDTTLEPDESFVVALSNVVGATVADSQGTGTIVNDDAPPPSSTTVVISQVYGGGGNADATLTHDFVELFNRGTTSVSLSNWSVQYISSNGSGTWAVQTLSGVIAPGGYYLVQLAQGAGGSVPLPTPDASGTIAMAAGAGKVALRTSTAAFTGGCPVGAVDLVGYGTASCFEGAGPTAALSNTTAALRKRGGCFDSDHNNIDFAVGGPVPRNTASPTVSCSPTPHAIHDIQSSGLITPFAGQFVSTSGIVTGRKTNGFFLQAPAGEYDNDPATSEALFVFTQAVPAVAVGDAVTAMGTATEFFQLTQIESTLPGDVIITAQGQTVPEAVTLTNVLLDPNGTPQQLEPLEGMRVFAASLTSVAPTNEFGETVAVLTGVPRPMREPGISVLEPVPPDPSSGVPDCCIPRFDENPERVMVDSDGLAGAAVVSVTTNVVFNNVIGPLDFTFGDYKVLPEVTPGVSANISGVPVPSPTADELTIGGFNIENFANDATRRTKAALAIRQLMRSPDVTGHIEILDLATLQGLADEVNAQTVTAGQPDPGYQAFLIPAPNAQNTQNVGFLVKTTRVGVDAVTQELAGETFTNPNTGQQELLHDRPPLVLRATFEPNGANPRSFIVVVNHLRSFIDIELVGGEGPRVRAKRTAQAESVARLLQDLQTANPDTAVISIGDYNAFQFNDGYTDPISVLLGTPTPDDQIVVDQSPDLVDPDFFNLTTLLPAQERYTFIFDGTPQVLDHVLVNTVARSYVQRYAIARGNSDFPELPASLFAGDATRPERSSDHDMPVGFFRFPPPAANLAVHASVSSATVAGGSQVVFTYTVTNAGPSSARDVLLTAQLGPNVTFVSCATTGGGSCNGSSSVPTVSFPLLAAGATETVTVVAAVPCAATNGAPIATLATLTSSTADPDAANNTAMASATASNLLPVISGVSATPGLLLLPLHQMVPITVNYSASDSCGAVTTQLSVTSDEPVTGPVLQQGLAGLTTPDWQVVDAHRVLVRAEYSLRGDGRVYTITIKATDVAGGVSTKQVVVNVPRFLLTLIGGLLP